jgi:hypothetical protein
MNHRAPAALAAAFFALGKLSPEAHAQWDSIRANNRSFYNGGGAEAHETQPAAAGRGGEAGRRQAHASEVAVNRGHEPERGRVEMDRMARDRRHFDIDEDRWHSYHWFGYHPGMIISALPAGYLSIYVGGSPYYYDQGVYYESDPTGYVVVTPPLGATVPALPPGAEPVAVGSLIYYFAAGAFYQQQPQGFMVVTPPLGVTVSVLPQGAVPVVIHGMQYYQAEGAYFMPNMQGGVTVYTTVQP